MPQTTPDAESIRRAVEKVLSQDEYRIEPPRESGSSAVSEFLKPLQEYLWGPLVEWWSELSGQFAWADEVLGGIVIAALLALLVQIIRLRRRRSMIALPTTEEAAASQPSELLRLATSAAEQGQYVRGVRLLLQAAKLRLEEVERRINRPGTTNRELLRRYRRSRLSRPLTTLVETVDRGWFGDRDCTRLDYLDCRAAHDEIAAAAVGGIWALRSDKPQLQPDGSFT